MLAKILSPNFNVKDFSQHDGAATPSNVIPNLKKLYSVLEKIRNHFRGPDVDVKSGYRSTKYQRGIWKKAVKKHGIEKTKKRVARPGHSQHEKGTAADIVIKGVKPINIAKFAASLPEVGGIGIYSDICHIDIRPRRKGKRITCWGSGCKNIPKVIKSVSNPTPPVQRPQPRGPTLALRKPSKSSPPLKPKHRKQKHIHRPRRQIYSPHPQIMKSSDFRLKPPNLTVKQKSISPQFTLSHPLQTDSSIIQHRSPTQPNNATSLRGPPPIRQTLKLDNIVQPKLSQQAIKEIMQKGVYVPGVWGTMTGTPGPNFNINNIKQPQISKALEREIMRKGVFVPGIWGTYMRAVRGRSRSFIQFPRSPSSASRFTQRPTSQPPIRRPVSPRPAPTNVLSKQPFQRHRKSGPGVTTYGSSAHRLSKMARKPGGAWKPTSAKKMISNVSKKRGGVRLPRSSTSVIAKVAGRRGGVRLPSSSKAIITNVSRKRGGLKIPSSSTSIIARTSKKYGGAKLPRSSTAVIAKVAGKRGGARLPSSSTSIIAGTARGRSARYVKPTKTHRTQTRSPPRTAVRYKPRHAPRPGFRGR